MSQKGGEEPIDNELRARSTEELLERVHAGDRKALEILIEREWKHIKDIMSGRMGAVLREIADTEDLIQDTVRILLLRGPGMRLQSRKHFQNLMACIACGHMRNQYRSLRPPEGVSREILDFDEADEMDAAVAAIDREEGGWTWYARLLLATEEQHLLHLRDHDKLSWEAIGSHVGRTADAARMWYGRVLSKAKQIARRLVNGELNDLLAEYERPPEVKWDVPDDGEPGAANADS